MKTIFKYRVPELFGKFRLTLPKDARILSFQEQQDKLYIWAIVEWDYVDDMQMHEQRFFAMHATGCELDVSGEHVGTVIAKNGLVYHLFEKFRKMLEEQEKAGV